MHNSLEQFNRFINQWQSTSWNELPFYRERNNAAPSIWFQLAQMEIERMTNRYPWIGLWTAPISGSDGDTDWGYVPFQTEEEAFAWAKFQREHDTGITDLSVGKASVTVVDLLDTPAGWRRISVSSDNWIDINDNGEPFNG